MQLFENIPRTQRVNLYKFLTAWANWYVYQGSHPNPLLVTLVVILVVQVSTTVPGGFSPYSSILQQHVLESPYLLTLLECEKLGPPLVF